MGPRTLSPHDPAYRGRYHGDVVSRDRALHQGCVHPWLLGQFVTAQMRVFGRGEASINEARKLLRANLDHLRRTGHGHLPELYDGDAPHRPGGAIACATTAAELLRCYVEDILDQQPGYEPVSRPQVTITVGKIPSKT
jgi:glycogen debranching enzyme